MQITLVLLTHLGVRPYYTKHLNLPLKISACSLFFLSVVSHHPTDTSCSMPLPSLQSPPSSLGGTVWFYVAVPALSCISLELHLPSNQFLQSKAQTPLGPGKKVLFINHSGQWIQKYMWNFFNHAGRDYF